MTTPTGIANLEPLARRKEQRAWYWYDWANSAYVTTIARCPVRAYLIAVAERPPAARRQRGPPVQGRSRSSSGWRSRRARWSSSRRHVATIVRAGASRSSAPWPTGPRARRMMAGFAWAGAAGGGAACSSSPAPTGSSARARSSSPTSASAPRWSSTTRSCARSPRQDERDRVSSRGWALGYLGGGLLLAVNFGCSSRARPFGLSEGMAVRISMLSAGAVVGRLHADPVPAACSNRPPDARRARDRRLRRAAQLRPALARRCATCAATRSTLTFLVAYLFYNDGIQTVIVSASIYGEKQLGFETGTVLIATYPAGAVRGRSSARCCSASAAERFGSRRVILAGLVVWMLVVTAALLPARAEHRARSWCSRSAIGLVLGGTQALSRSFFSLLIPARPRGGVLQPLPGDASAGTSWFGTLVFGLVHQLTDSYRPAIFALIVFFVVGGVLLARVDARARHPGGRQRRLRSWSEAQRRHAPWRRPTAVSGRPPDAGPAGAVLKVQPIVCFVAGWVPSSVRTLQRGPGESPGRVRSL